MTPERPTYEEMMVRLNEAESALDAIQNARIDAVVGKDGVYMLRLLEMEKALHLERSRLRTILEQLPEGVLVAEAPSGKIVMGNQQAENIWRKPVIPSATVAGYRHYKGFHPDGRQYRPDEWPLARTIATGEVVDQEEIQIERGDGSRRWIFVNSMPIRDKKGCVVSGVVTFLDITERKRMEKSLEESRDELEVRVRERTAELERLTVQLRRLNMQLMINESTEKDRIATLLHDDVQQLLVGARIQLELITDQVQSAKQETLRKSIQLINRAVRVSRTLTEELSPKSLEQDEMGEIIGWLCDFMKKTHGLTVRPYMDNKVGISDKNIRLFLYQAVRELLFNVVKHAGVHTARVGLRRDGNVLEISVSDDGKGFHPPDIDGDDQESNFGLFSMREKLSLLGGSLEVDSTPGNGTRCTLMVPL
ncbi:MAG: ATP-binding protein [Deltaproteobacteria bacterium]